MIVYAGNKLQANPAATTGDPTPSTAWQWTRNGIAITGATASTYVASAQDLGSNLSVIQQAINLVGTAVATASAVGPVTLFSPAVMFSTGINGVWYDPSDLSTLYRDAAGTLPVTAVEQPVGLMLDKSKQLVLGSELVTNGDFSNGTTGWTIGAGWAVSAGVCVGTNAASGSNVAVTNNITTVVGKWYEASWTVSSYSTGTLQLLVFNGSGNYSGSQNVIATGTYKFRFLATSTTTKIYFSPTTATAFNGVVDDVSLKELPGNHAFNPSGNSANFPVLSARYNLLTKTEDLTDAAWFKQTGTSVSPTKVAAPDASITAFSVTGNGTSGIYQVITGTLSLGQSVRSVYLRVPTGTATVGIKDPVLTQGTTTCNLTTSWQRFTLTETTPPDSGFVAGIWIFNIPASSIEVAWPDTRSVNDALNQPTYQRVNTSTDYDTVGFKPYLRFNGVSQWLQTNSIDFSYGDKMFVCAGVRKLSDGAIGALLETSANSNTNAGAIWLLAPGSPGSNQYSFRSKGTSASDVNVTGYAAPITNVLSGIGNIGGDQAILRINGAQAATSISDQGTGNYGNYPLYIGARAGSSLWFNGRLYGLTVAGKQASASEISGNEYFLNSKTNAY